MDGLDNFDISQVELDDEIRIVFMGTPDFAVPVLEQLCKNYNVRAVVTQPDKLVGRKQVLTESPVKKYAKEHTMLILQPQNIKDEWNEIVALHPNLIITCAYGQIIPRELLVYPKHGCINVHASLLPKLRGGAPIHHAIMDGYSKTGVTIMYMNPYMDEGDIISQKEIEIQDSDTTETLWEKLSLMGRDLLIETLPSIIDGTCNRIKQNNEEATYGKNITKEEERIDFSKTTRKIFNQIRGLNSWPGAYCLYQGKRLKIWASRESNYADPFKIDGQIMNIYDDGIGVKTSNGEIIITEIQFEGKNRIKVKDYLNGIQDKNSLIGKVLE